MWSAASTARSLAGPFRRAFSPSIADRPSRVKTKSPLGRSTVLSYGWAATGTPPSSLTFASTSRTGHGAAEREEPLVPARGADLVEAVERVEIREGDAVEARLLRAPHDVARGEGAPPRVVAVDVEVDEHPDPLGTGPVLSTPERPRGSARPRAIGLLPAATPAASGGAPSVPRRRG